MSESADGQAGAGGIMPEEAMLVGKQVFDAWWERWEGVIYDNGSRGEPYELLVELWKSWKNSK
jgi:hypothetical protein